MASRPQIGGSQDTLKVRKQLVKPEFGSLMRNRKYVKAKSSALKCLVIIGFFTSTERRKKHRLVPIYRNEITEQSRCYDLRQLPTKLATQNLERTNWIKRIDIVPTSFQDLQRGSGCGEDVWFLSAAKIFEVSQYLAKLLSKQSFYGTGLRDQPSTRFTKMHSFK